MRSLLILCLSTAELLTVVSPVLSWHEKHLMPEGVSGGTSAFLSGELIYAGGTAWRDQVKHWLADTYLYDPHKDQWSKGPALPEPLAYGAFIRTDQSLEILGGVNETGLSLKSWRLDAGSDKWIASGQVPSGSLFGSAEIIQKKVYLFGGCSDVDLHHCSASVLRRNHSGEWEKVSEMPDGPITLFASTVLNNQAYLFGGCSNIAPGGVRNRNEALRYDPQTNQWKVLHSMPIAARGMTVTPLDQHHLLVAGGYTDSSAGFSDSAYIYDTVHDEYTPASALPFPVMGIEMVQHDGSVWALGGEDKQRHRSPRLFEATLK
jgi:N-acetylneuraminic acid mutarotase